MAEGSSSFTVPARLIKAPMHLSASAQARLSPQPQFEYPPVEDKAAWRDLIEQVDRNMALGFESMAGHFEGGEACKTIAGLTAAMLQKRVWSIDYRMPPESPYPAGLDDGLAVYRALLQEHSPDEIIVNGLSAGGNLAAALLLRAREAGLPMPAGLVLGTPEVDLTESGDSFQTNIGVDAVLRSLMPVNIMYANGTDLRDPHLSPLFGDLKGFPPTILYTGTRDLYLSNTVRMHRALRTAGVTAELHVMEAAGHSGFPGAPEGDAIYQEVRNFVASVLKG
ncbi:uncharacterized protein RCC_03204 [Ramularia collo-cygni]|uniref:Alpha/beta hydrolase fold-3 domain-containing protein n=1 Tax=Ramularia collo-cygni TaxID=112498 RepID=A0A2D3UWA7_9PEZI|nr:uncharacterized protein RCC_03204 [Ramularia collo-cygni]CZT17370.1 uncharacterized protein RCC_03204 [Ramularia collo-cygni]